ncbi:MAG: carbohydrate kinase family protein [Lachnospiraceae bacterium]|nr:carbohydrate kinase family protein [Lachnospiraceae bacterium]
MGKKVIVAGHICLDITPVFSGKRVSGVSEVLQPGKLLEMGPADVHTGGSVANTGLAMKFFGADVSLMGKVGTDAFGDMICNILEKYDVTDGMIRQEGESTSYSVVLAMPGIDRIFLHNPGANHTFCAEDVSEDMLKGISLFHFGYPPLMRSMYKNEGEELLEILKKAKNAGCATSLDMAAVDEDSEAGRADWKRILEKIIPYIDFFVPSVEELCFMLDRPRFIEWQQRAEGRDITEVLDVESDIKPLAQQCMKYGAKVLLIKCGASGMYYCSGRCDGLMDLECSVGIQPALWGEKEGFEKSYVPERILSGTGAGDTSIAAFLAAMLEGYSIEKCMQFATATGASCVAAYDALSGLKTFDELRDRIEAGWKKV